MSVGRSRLVPRPLWALLFSTAVLGAALTIADPSPGQSSPSCFSKPATLTGTGAISGTAGNDVIVGSAGADSIQALDGNDSVCGLDGFDALFGGVGTDLLDGGNGSDRLDGGDGPDRLLGAAGDDELVAGLGADVMGGGTGNDTALLAASSPVLADLDNVADDGRSGEGDNVLADVENMVGGQSNDRLTGNAAANRLHGGAGGVDTLSGLGGADALTGFGTLSGGDGNDILLANGDGFGDRTSDTLSGGAGDDLLDGGEGEDGDQETDEEEGLAPDILNGGTGSDTVDYSFRRLTIEVTLDGAANDGTVIVRSPDFFVMNCDDPDSLTEEERARCEDIRRGIASAQREGDNVNPDVENMRGGSGDDILTGNASANWLIGGRGWDVLEGFAGDDRLEANEPAGTVVEPDTVRCGAGIDRAVVDLQDGPAGFPDCETVEQAPIDQHPTVRIDRRASLTARRDLEIRISCPRASRQRCRGNLKVAFMRRPERALASRPYRRIARGRSRIVSLRLSPSEARLARRGRKLRASARETDPRGRPKRSLATLALRD